MQKAAWKRKTALFLLGQGISLFGSSLVQYAVIWYVTLETNSGIMVTVLTLCSFLPQLLISLFAGVWADRFSRKTMIIVADGSIALATLGLIFIIRGSDSYYWALLLVSAVRSAGAGMQTPAVNAVIPQLVPPERLMRISGINGSIQSLVGIVAPAVAGGLLAAGSMENVLFIDVITAAIGIGILLCIAIPLHQKARERLKGGYLDDFKSGLKYSFHNRFLRRLLIIEAITCLVISPALYLNVLFVSRAFGSDYYYLTLNEISFFLGAIGGGVVISTWGGFKNRLKTLALGCCAFAVSIIVAGVAQHFWVYLLSMVLCGFSMPMVNSPMMVLVQEKAEPDMQGRVFSMVQIMMTCVMPLGLLIFGPLADVVDIRWIMIGSGLLVFPVLLGAMRLKGFYSQGCAPPKMPTPEQGAEA